MRRPPQSPNDFRIVVSHHNIRPKMVVPPEQNTIVYESKIVTRGNQGEHQLSKGSIFPDDMKTYGRIKDGRYPIQLGFHARGNNIPTEDDLVVRVNGFRAALIINADKKVDIIRDSGPCKSPNLHIHGGGGPSYRNSKGCLTISSELGGWTAFISVFLGRYPNPSDWHTPTGLGEKRYICRRVGTLIVKS